MRICTTSGQWKAEQSICWSELMAKSGLNLLALVESSLPLYLSSGVGIEEVEAVDGSCLAITGLI